MIISIRFRSDIKQLVKSDLSRKNECVCVLCLSAAVDRLTAAQKCYGKARDTCDAVSCDSRVAPIAQGGSDQASFSITAF